MPRTFKPGSLLMALLTGAGLASMNVSAQTGDVTTGSSLDAVVVTAERRATRLDETPVSLDAYTAERIDQQGLRSMDDVTRLTPGVTFSRSGMTATGNFNDEGSDIAIRGIESTAGTSTTGLYLDDTPIQTRHLSFGTVNPFPELFDLDRIEVLRGPQGTLFGAGSEGGTIRFIQTEPGLTAYSGYVRSELASTKGGDPSYEVSGAVGGPIVQDKLGFRLSASIRDDGGFVNRVSYNPDSMQVNGSTQSDSNWQRTVSVRGALKFAVTDALTITPSVNYQQLYINDTGAYWASLSNTNAGILNNGDARRDTSTDPFLLSAVKIDWESNSFQATSNTSFFSRDQRATTDYTQILRELFLGTYVHQPGDLGTATFTDEQRNFTEEIRLQSLAKSNSSLTWLAGLFYSHLRENTTETIADPNLVTEVGGFTNPPPYPGGVIYDQNPFLAVDEQIALFGQADYKLTPELTLTGGVRVESVKSIGKEYYAGPFVGPVPGTASGSITEHPVTPKFGLSYQPDNKDLFYLSIAKGYRIGGINANLGTLCAASLTSLGLKSDPLKYDSDSLWSYEIGAKNTLLDGKLQINSSLFYIDWKNIQQNVTLLSCGLQFTANLGAAVSKGFDVDIHYRPLPALLLGLEAGYTHAAYTTTVDAGAGGSPVVSRGDLLAAVPWKLDVSAEYDFTAFAEHVPYVRLDDQYSSSENGVTPIQDGNNGNSDSTLPGPSAANDLSLRGGVRFSGFDVSLFANNVLNSLPILVTARDTTSTSLYYQRTWRPRTIGITATYRF